MVSSSSHGAVVDSRLRDYMLGCNELIFNPLVRWWRLGPRPHVLYERTEIQARGRNHYMGSRTARLHFGRREPSCEHVRRGTRAATVRGGNDTGT